MHHLLGDERVVVARPKIGYPFLHFWACGLWLGGGRWAVGGGRRTDDHDSPDAKRGSETEEKC